MWYEPGHTLTHNALINMVIGPRGAGKTYGLKTYAVKQWLKRGKQFIYVRRGRDELDLVKGRLFADTDLPVSCKGDMFLYERSEEEIGVCGFAIPLSVAHKYKSASFPDVDLVIFDEFIVNTQAGERYLTGEIDKFLNLLETVIRTREGVKVFMLANSLSFFNPYTMYWGLQNKGTFNKSHDGMVLCEIYANEEFKQRKKATEWGRLIEGTRFGNMAVDNRFVLDNSDFIYKRKGNWRFLCGIVLEGNELGVWQFGRSFHVDHKISNNEAKVLMFAVDQADVGNGRVFHKKPPFFATVAQALRAGELTFEDIQCKGLMLKFLSKYV